MSDEAERPLTRRERRLREMGESGLVPSLPETEGQPEVEAPAAEAPVAPVPPADDEIEISPVNEDGTPRSRREMRMLREQALAARAAATPAAEAVLLDEETPEIEADSTPATSVAEESAATEESSAAAESTALKSTDETEGDDAEDASDLESRLAETQPLTLDELRELQEESQRESDVTEGEAAARVAPEPASDTVEPVSEAAKTAAEPVEHVVGPEAGAQAGDEESPTTSEEPQAKPEEPQKSYSFPDIAPLDESVSVFDEPVQHAPAPAAELSRGDFDDLISRAVAQEGAASATNTSALILPNLPDTGELSGPIGETGELFITGSIELPKSLGETGGHTPLHDSAGPDPLEELGLDAIPTSGDPISPVAASRAVSARSAAGPVVAQETKEKSKLPLVLILTGGGLVVAVGALLIWGASAGMFG